VGKMLRSAFDKTVERSAWVAADGPYANSIVGRNGVEVWRECAAARNTAVPCWKSTLNQFSWRWEEMHVSRRFEASFTSQFRW